MKMKVIILFTCLILVSHNYKNTQAASDEYLEVHNTINNVQYDVKLKITYMGNTVNNFKVGEKLGRYSVNIYSMETDWHTIVTGFKWENSEYIIKSGDQNVNVTCTTLASSMQFNVNITGVSDNSNAEKLTTESVKGADNTKAKVISNYDVDTTLYNMSFGSDALDTLPKGIFYDLKGKKVEGKITYSNYVNLVVGEHDISWSFIPINSLFESKTGIIKVKVNENLADIEEPISPTLTSNTILLNTGTAYDINLYDKVAGSKYAWSTSNSKVAKVNNKNGVVTALKNGQATITCEITTPDNQTYTLSSDIIVGEDDNFPTLTDTELDLNVGDKYDVDVENSIAKSKYKWTTSDKSVAKVNSSTGVISGVKEGIANIYCTITTKNKEIIVLKCEVTINK